MEHRLTTSQSTTSHSHIFPSISSTMEKFWCFPLALLVLCAPVVSRKERNVPHPHRGVLKPYQPGPFDLDLSGADEKELLSGKSVMKQIMPGKGEKEPGGGAICIQDILAPKQAVWSQILRMNDYEGKVPRVSALGKSYCRTLGTESKFGRTGQRDA